MGTDHDFTLDMEAASARVQALVEDETSQHDIELHNLSNAEVLTLYSAISLGLQQYHNTQNKLQFEMLKKQAETIQSDADELFCELDDIHSQATRNAPDPEEFSPSRRDRFNQFVRSPFGSVIGENTLQDRIWAFGVLMILFLVLIGLANLTILSTNESIPLVRAIVALLGAVSFSFVLGVATGRLTDGPSPGE